MAAHVGKCSSHRAVRSSGFETLQFMLLVEVFVHRGGRLLAVKDTSYLYVSDSELRRLMISASLLADNKRVR